MITNASSAGTSHFVGLSMPLTSIVHDWVKHLLGATAVRAAFGVLTWSDLVVAIGVLFCVLVVHALVAVAMRHTKRKGAVTVASWPSFHLVVEALGKPIYVLIWLFGIYVSIMTLLLSVHNGVTSVSV